jgi:hypothetical protein
MELELENINATIERDGFIIVPMIDMTGLSPMVAHTVGLKRTLNVPELIIVGMDLRMAIGAIHYIVEEMKKKGGAFAERESVPLPDDEAAKGTASITVMDALQSEIDAFPLPVLSAIYGEEAVPMQQVILPANGAIYPWEEGFPAHVLDSQCMFWTPGGVEKVAPHTSGDAECTDLNDLIPDSLRADKQTPPLH